MSPEAKRIAIARACGWEGFENSGAFLIGVPPQNSITRKAFGLREITNWTPRFDVPDYLNDLNAIREAEKFLTAHQIEAYLRHIVPNEQQWIQYPMNAYWCLRHASAKECADAFIKVLNLHE